MDALAVGSIRDKWIAHLARELRKVRAQAERLSLKTAPERIIHYIESVGEGGVLHLNQSKKDWAAEPRPHARSALSRAGADEKAGAAYHRR
ncbi:hypothetical protein [Bradyrhizobium sp. Leaf401]|uniref:hypothetical protein n=1 Tax=Bradyrhizobium sp. Leaf401 TaxID=2876564 RepID=UPI001E2E3A57|nr:hypothetical protein [Bradyrhizobium sp. Leaf401]